MASLYLQSKYFLNTKDLSHIRFTRFRYKENISRYLNNTIHKFKKELFYLMQRLYIFYSNTLQTVTF